MTLGFSWVVHYEQSRCNGCRGNSQVIVETRSSKDTAWCELRVERIAVELDNICFQQEGATYKQPTKETFGE